VIESSVDPHIRLETVFEALAAGGGETTSKIKGGLKQTPTPAVSGQSVKTMAATLSTVAPTAKRRLEPRFSRHNVF
jgi:hypothetical protein